MVHVYRRRWFQVLAAGIFFYAVIQASYLAFTNAILLPAMMFYGALIVPAAYMVYLFERLGATELPLAAIALHALFDTTLQLQGEPSWVGALGWLVIVVALLFLLWLTVRIVRKTREAMDAEPGLRPALPNQRPRVTLLGSASA